MTCNNKRVRHCDRKRTLVCCICETSSFSVQGRIQSCNF